MRIFTLKNLAETPHNEKVTIEARVESVPTVTVYGQKITPNSNRASRSSFSKSSHVQSTLFKAKINSRG